MFNFICEITKHKCDTTCQYYLDCAELEFQIKLEQSRYKQKEEPKTIPYLNHEDSIGE